MFIKVNSTIAAFILATSTLAANDRSRDSNFEDFKREMMPQVGKQITVVGVLKSGKIGWLVAFKEWGVYIYDTKSSDIPKMNILNRFEGHNVRVTGTLRYFAVPPARSDRIEAAPPEHFYFDVAEARVVSLSPSRSKRPKGRRGRKTSALSTPPDNVCTRPRFSVAVIRSRLPT